MALLSKDYKNNKNQNCGVMTVRKEFESISVYWELLSRFLKYVSGS